MSSSVKACLPTLLLEKFDEILKQPEDFIKPRAKLAQDLVALTKQLYDDLKDFERESDKFARKKRVNSDALPELIIENFDDEQIWQELELQNDSFQRQTVKEVSKLLVAKNNEEFTLLPGISSMIDPIAADDDDDDDNNEEDDHNDDGDVDNNEDADDENDYLDDESDQDDLEMSAAKDDENFGDDAMSDSSIELEKALDMKIAMDQRLGLNSESDDDQVSSNDHDENEDVDEDVDDENGDAAEDFDEEEKTKTSKTFAEPKRQTVVDDQFFSLAELEDFLQEEDKKEMKKIDGKDSDKSEEDEADFELFHDYGDPSTGKDNKQKSGRFLWYDDFFDPPRRQIPEVKSTIVDEEVTLDPLWKNRHKTLDQTNTSLNPRDNPQRHQIPGVKSTNVDEEVTLDPLWKNRHKLLDQTKTSLTPAENPQPLDDDNEEPNDESIKPGEEKSAFEIRQEKIKRKVQVLEQQNLAPKSWQMIGEASASIRPENSLLQEYLQFDHMTRQAPIITEATTMQLEDIIKLRIKDQIWDDVERKIKPADEPYEYKKKIVLDQEKSKLSLAEVYEQEYVKQQQTETEKETEEPKEHKEIKEAMSSLFTKLDALSNFHFVPKPLRPELKIVNNLPAIMVEEVAPVTVSDAMLLAPEEIKEKSKGVELGRSERTSTDMKRERREKKVKQRAKRKQKEAKQKLVAKLNPGLGNKYSKIAAMKKLTDEGAVTVLEGKGDKIGRKSLSSSNNFFSQLQEQVNNPTTAKKGSKIKDKQSKTSASKLKL